ncbi:MAG: V-type ATPase subunit [Candidatus Krumholzibacteria bacterium]|nr:V-type ATPase subunit [Candidatus Krumholzibacteria bacterium]
MILGPVSRYSLVNAKIRSRMAAILPPDTIARCVSARDLSEFYATLSGTVYEPVLSRPEVSLDPRIAERLLIEQEVKWHADLIKDVRDPEKQLVVALLEKYELENLKAALRIREGDRSSDDLKYLIRKNLPHALPYQSIAEARTLDEVLQYLVATPYLLPIRGSLDEYKQKGTLFPVEIAVELDYYRRIKAKIDALGRSDKPIARRLIGLQIDIKNIGWLIRLKFYYNIPSGDLIEYNIPGGYRLTSDRMRHAFAADSIKDVLAIALERSFKPAADIARREEELSKLYLLEIILWDYLVHEAKKTYGGFPFTIGTVLSYLILKRTEIMNLITVLNGKVLKLEKSDIEGHLRTAF